MTYSSIGKRILATIIDSIVINIIASFFIFAGYGGFIISSNLLFILYNVLLMGSSWHATLGQKAMNICVIDGYGAGIDYGKALIRAICSLLSSIILGIGYLVALFSNEKQTLHDKLAGTFVVDAAPTYVATPTPAPTPAPVPERPFGGQGRITGISGEKAGMSYAVQGNGIMIGRDPAVCQVVMSNATGVSRLHCLVSYNASNGLYIVSDRNSTYGTFTESGRKISPTNSLALKPGERFYVGSSKNMFEVG